MPTGTVSSLTGTYASGTGSAFNATGKATGFTNIDLKNGGSFTAASVGILASYIDDADSRFTMTDSVTLSNDTTIKGDFSSSTLTLGGDTTDPMGFGYIGKQYAGKLVRRKNAPGTKPNP